MNTHASPGLGHAPLHAGVSASPHDIARHSHDAVPTAVPQRLPGAHVPRHWPSMNSQPAGDPIVVVVVEAPGPVVVEAPGLVVVVLGEPDDPWVGRHTQRVARNRTGRWPNASATVVAGGRGGAQRAK